MESILPATPGVTAGISLQKRLFVCCDGTWKDGINNKAPLTNVSRIARSLSHVSEDNYLQLVYYDSGIGNGTNLSGQTIDGVTGRGISAKIRNAYSFISHNYQDGDEIILLGFSRGAFTAQCIASLIDQIGLLRKEDLQYLRPLFKLWANQELKTWTGKTQIRDRLEDIVRDFIPANMSFQNVRIKACALWDTVAALGLPTPTLSPRPFSFVGKTVPGSVDYAFHALALNENRHHFKPLIWRSAARSCRRINQCWFLGSHADVGGGNEDSGLAAVSLMWMASNLMALGVSFVPENLFDFFSPQYTVLVQNIDRKLGTLDAKVKISSRASTEGSVNKNGWYWSLAGLKFRGKYLNSHKDVFHQSQQQSDDNNTQEQQTTEATNLEQQSSQPAEHSFVMTIHFSVRFMMGSRRNSCDVLKKWTTQKYHNKKIYWANPALDQTIQEDESPRAPPIPAIADDEIRGVSEHLPNNEPYEWYQLKSWFHANQKVKDQKKKESILTFLYDKLPPSGIPSEVELSK